jgi:DNA-binding transcriptional MerR regulator
MTINDAAMASGLSAHTIRFYEKRGVVPPIPRTGGGVRNFSHADVELLQFLGQLRQIGMSLDDITTFIEDGCTVEHLRRDNKVPVGMIAKRLCMLRLHQQQLRQQQDNIGMLLSSVGQKIAYYEQIAEENKT